MSLYFNLMNLYFASLFYSRDEEMEDLGFRTVLQVDLFCNHTGNAGMQNVGRGF